MNYISTTELRTRSKELIEELKAGNSVSLIHRSKVVGTIEPSLVSRENYKKHSLKSFFKQFGVEKPLAGSADEVYRKQLEAKYGKDIS